MDGSKGRLVGVAAALAAVTMLAGLTAAATAGVGQKCPGTFRVLHDDRIDNMPVPAGNYAITVKRMSCPSASDYFRQFLAAAQNGLPKGWKLFRGRMKFKNRKQNVAFRIKRVGGGGGGGAMTGRCPGTFQVLHDDRIDNLPVPAGRYRIKVKRMACQSAAGYFKQFLAADTVAKGWKLIKPKRKFKNRKGNFAFRIKQVG
ncbi:MAG: hypothetical protein EDQ89_05350 [Acidobacteria bacterium]|nr:MAG: hypothetical protein EDQ89_05350 [Acidobacteriota bacterium]